MFTWFSFSAPILLYFIHFFLCRLWRTSLPLAWPSITPINLPSYSTCSLERSTEGKEENNLKRTHPESAGSLWTGNGEVREKNFSLTIRSFQQDPLHSGNSRQYSGNDLWRGTQRALSHSLTILFALGESSISACAFTETTTIAGSFYYYYFLFIWRYRAKGHAVCQICDLQGEIYSFFFSCLSSS